jgi:type 1 glutamine amidotransferase
VAIGDLDRDGKPDVVMRGETGSVVTLFKQNGPGSWLRRDLVPGGGTQGLALADLNKDGFLDIVVGGRWLKNPRGKILSRPWQRRSFGSWSPEAALEIGDLNGDGRSDVVMTVPEEEGRISWFENPANPGRSRWKERVIDPGPLDSAQGVSSALRSLGAANHFAIDATEEAGQFTTGNLNRYKAVVFLSTSGDVLNGDQQAAFMSYIRNGGGFVGIHSAADTEHGWPWYGGLVGAYFASHPAPAQARIRVENRDHPSTRTLPDPWNRFDEWYDFQQNPRGQGVTVLLSVDEASYAGGQMGNDHPIAWYHEYDGGRAWYTGGGHTDASFSEPAFLEHLLGGIRYAAGAP